MSLRDHLEEPVSRYMSESFVHVRPEESVTEAARLMKESGSTEALVVKEGEPIGIVTERDILYKVVAAGSQPSKVTVGEVMSSPVEKVEDTSRVQDAIAKMSRLGLRRLGVTKKGRIVGIVTQKAMVTGAVRQEVALPELAQPDKLHCPYCDAVMMDKNELSRHIDQVHLGLGLLEGDTSKW